MKSSEMLEFVKERVTLVFGYGFKECVAKDMAIVMYGPRGCEDYAILPLSWKRPIAKNLEDFEDVALATLKCKELLDYVEKNKVSHSLFYDFDEWVKGEALESIATGGVEREEALRITEGLMKRVFKRNKDENLEIYKKTLESLSSRLCGGKLKLIYFEIVERVKIKDERKEEEKKIRFWAHEFIKCARLMRGGLR